MPNFILLTEQGAGQTQQTSGMFGLDFMMMFNIFIAAYLLYYAIKGSGKVYENDYPKEMKESHAKFLRKFCWITGVGMLILSVLAYLEYQKGNLTSIYDILSIAFVLGCITVYFIVFRTRYKQYLAKPKTPSKDVKK